MKIRMFLWMQWLLLLLIAFSASTSLLSNEKKKNAYRNRGSAAEAEGKSTPCVYADVQRCLFEDCVQNRSIENCVSVALSAQYALIPSKRSSREIFIPHLKAFPDQSLGLLHNSADGKKQFLMTALTDTFRVTGLRFPQETLNLEHSIVTWRKSLRFKKVLEPRMVSAPQPLPVPCDESALSSVHDYNYAGVGGTFTIGEQNFGVYHAEDHRCRGNIAGTNIPGFHSSIGLAYANSEEIDYHRFTEPILESAGSRSCITYFGQVDTGVANPGVVTSVDDRYVYIFFEDHARILSQHISCEETENHRGVQISVARASKGDLIDYDGSGASPWKKLLVTETGAHFISPGRGGIDTPVVNYYDYGMDAFMPFVTYSPFLKRYVMIHLLCRYSDLDSTISPVAGAPLTGMYVSFSKDLISWSPSQMLFAGMTLPVEGKSLQWQPTIVWDDSTGEQGWLVYGYTSRWSNDSNRVHMVGRRIQLIRSN